MRVDKTLTVEGFREYVAAVRSCGDHPIPNLTDEVLASVREVIECFIEVSERYEDTTGKVIVRLVDGTYGLFIEWSDSSGHG